MSLLSVCLSVVKFGTAASNACNYHGDLKLKVLLVSIFFLVLTVMFMKVYISHKIKCINSIMHNNI